MTDEEMADWNRLNWQARLNLVHSTPCEDCTASFAAEMRGLGMCNGFPGPQRYCARCERWWPEGRRYWLPYARGPREAYACRTCRKRRQQARWYRTRYQHNPAFRAAELVRGHLRYQRNRESILARVHAARAKP